MAEYRVMDIMVISVVSVVLFCVCSHYFLKSVLSPIPYFRTPDYSRSALKVKKIYKVFSFGVLTVVFMIALVVSFIQVYTELS